MNKPIYVTQPALPMLAKFIPYLWRIWTSKYVTNCGPFHNQLESELSEYLGADEIFVSNGTLALMVALKALDIKGSVITTPFSFVATTSVLSWAGIKPIYVDINPTTLGIDSSLIEDAIESDTTAVLPVHVYGKNSHSNYLSSLCDKKGLKLVYDGAHAFGVQEDGHSILNFGDLSVLSFHATKVFNTFEGGAIICHSKEMKERLCRMRNFGFTSDVSVELVGINAKMNEINSAIGLLQS